VDQLIFYPCTWWHVVGRDFYGWPSAVELVMRSDAELNARGELMKINGQPGVPGRRDPVRRTQLAGLLTDGEKTLRRAMVIEAAAARAEDNPVPSFELHNVGEALTGEEIDRLLSRWVEARHKYGVAYTSKGLETKAHGAAPEQLLIDGRRRIDLELVRHMNAQPWMAGVATEGSSLTYANVQDQWRDAINITFAPYMAAVADRLSMPDVTPRGWEVRFDADSLTQDPQSSGSRTMRSDSIRVPDERADRRLGRLAHPDGGSRVTMQLQGVRPGQMPPSRPARAADERHPHPVRHDRRAGAAVHDAADRAARRLPDGAAAVGPGEAPPRSQRVRPGGVPHRAVGGRPDRHVHRAGGPNGDRALEEARNGLRDGLSVGFAASKFKEDADGNLHILAGELYEVSLVAVPDFAGARIAASAASTLERIDMTPADQATETIDVQASAAPRSAGGGGRPRPAADVDRAGVHPAARLQPVRRGVPHRAGRRGPRPVAGAADQPRPSGRAPHERRRPRLHRPARLDR
jgi:hypothetical protein